MHWNEYTTQALAAAQGIHTPSLYALQRTLHIARREGRTVFTCGNGGSAANASHLAQDLSKGTRDPNRIEILRTICLNDSVPSLTAWANDDGYEWAFSQQLVALGRPNDILIAISGSGNSPNVLNAIKAAHAKQMRTWGLTGFDGGKLINTAHCCVHVPCHHMGQVEDAHSQVIHWLVDALKEGLCLQEVEEAQR
jgi:D-sedoheptulose 7-phosphate isomerase